MLNDVTDSMMGAVMSALIVVCCKRLVSNSSVWSWLRCLASKRLRST